MKSTPRLLGAALMLGIVVSGCSSGPVPLPPPDATTWKPANVDGPALFVGKAIRSEEFKDPPNANYACHTVYDKTKNDNLGKVCISNACGLDRFTFVADTTYQGNIPSPVVLYTVMGEWCESTIVDGQRFLIAVLPNGHWSAFELMDDGSDPLTLPNNSGCLGDVDMKPLLRAEGKSIGPFHSKYYLEWRGMWPEGGTKGCDGWITKGEDVEYKALPLSTMVAAWKQHH